MNKKIKCPFCFERFSIEIFVEDGNQQEIIYDCEVCCHPIEILANWNESDNKLSLDVRKSTGFE